MHKKKIAIWGATGSIGRQTLEVIAAHKNYFETTLLVANTDVNTLITQAHQFRPESVLILDESKAHYLKSELPFCKVYVGAESAIMLASELPYDIMMMAITGFAALPYVLSAIRAGKTIALANKELMVVGGSMIMQEVKKQNTTLIPVDSEHAGIFQCLKGEDTDYNKIISQLILTASGGPFRGKKSNFLTHVRPEHALKHPVWNMGKKISIDSATLMNKGLELIEARWLFDLDPKKLNALIHPEAKVHCIISFIDGSLKIQASESDMRIPIANALSYPVKLPTPFPNIMSLMNLENFHFETIDEHTFRCFRLAKQVLLEDNALASCVLNAANEVAVSSFIAKRIGFLDIASVIEETLERYHTRCDYANINLATLMETDKKSREIAEKIAKNYENGEGF